MVMKTFFNVFTKVCTSLVTPAFNFEPQIQHNADTREKRAHQTTFDGFSAHKEIT
jgi:hypothetical protein